MTPGVALDGWWAPQARFRSRPKIDLAVVVGAVLFGWNRRAVALKQLHRDSSLPMPEGDVEVSAD